MAATKAASAAEATRSLTVDSASRLLRDVKKIYVDSVGDAATHHSIREMLIAHLRASNRFAVTQIRDEADALLKVSIEQAQATLKNSNSESAKASVLVQLINANGDVIWPLKRIGADNKYEGSSAQVSNRIIRDLLNDADKSERQR